MTTATATPPARIRREDLKPGEILCSYCTARCCRYFALPIDTPKDWEDFDHIRWYMLHGRVAMFVEEGSWYLMVYADCQHLLPDNRCGTYETRPDICRRYTTENCEYDDDACYDQFFETPDQILEYAEALLPRRVRPEYLQPRASTSLPILLEAVSTNGEPPKSRKRRSNGKA